MQRANERGAALKQRHSRGDELLGLEAVDVAATGGDRDGKEAERITHGREDYSSKRVIALLRRFAISARCWLESETCAMDAVCCSTTALTSCDVAAF